MIRILLIATFVVLGTYACAVAPTAKVDFDNTQDFSAYRSFSWHSDNPMRVGKSTVQPKSTLQPSIMAAIQSNLEARGYRFETDALAADFVVSFVVGSREQDAPNESCNQGAVGGWSTAFCGGGDDTSYSQGVLAIDVFDASEQRQVWHGVAGRRISATDREDMSELIDSIVAEILSNYPPN